VTRRRRTGLRGRPVLVQVAVAAGALALAGVVWLRPPRQGAPGEVPVAPLGRGEGQAAFWTTARTAWTSPDERLRVARSGCGSPPAPPCRHRTEGLARTEASRRRGTAPRPGPMRARPGARRTPTPAFGGRADAGLPDPLRTIREAPPPPPRELLGNDVAEQLLDRVLAPDGHARPRPGHPGAEARARPRGLEQATPSGDRARPLLAGPDARLRGLHAARCRRRVPARPRRAPLARPGGAGPGPLGGLEPARGPAPPRLPSRRA
jgi:hypothetical protein